MAPVKLNESHWYFDFTAHELHDRYTKLFKYNCSKMQIQPFVYSEW